MPVHDWTRVSAGTFHAFHNAWITHIQETLNGGLLPPGYYALGEQRSGDIGPDVLALHATEEVTEETFGTGRSESVETGMIAVAERPPRVSATRESNKEDAFYLQKRRTLVIYHSTGDRIVALIEIVSPGNKHSAGTVHSLFEKVTEALSQRFHVLLIDLFPPGASDPGGLNHLIWRYIEAEDWFAPTDRPLCLASYAARTPVTAYVEHLAVGSRLVEMPLFLTRDHYVNVPLEETYVAAWRGVPERWRRVIEA